MKKIINNEMMEKVKLEVLGIGQSQYLHSSFAMILVEENGNRRLPIIIGNSEAQAIAIELEKMRPQRPLTHDLFKTLIDSFEIALNEVIIYKVYEGVFYSKLILEQNANITEIDSRTSDAVSIAIRVGCPIYTYEHILNTIGLTKEELNEEETEDNENVTKEEREIPILKTSNRYSAYSLEELNALLEESIEQEDYEKASKIRDEIKIRKDNNE